MMDLLHSTSLTPPRLHRPEVVTSAGETWSSEEQAARDLELLRATLERATRWPPQRDLEMREWRLRAMGLVDAEIAHVLGSWDLESALADGVL